MNASIYLYTPFISTLNPQIINDYNYLNRLPKQQNSSFIQMGKKEGKENENYQQFVNFTSFITIKNNTEKM